MEALLPIHTHQLLPQHQGDVTIPILNLINPPTSQGGEANSDAKYKDGDTGDLLLFYHHQNGVQKGQERGPLALAQALPGPHSFPLSTLDLSHGHELSGGETDCDRDVKSDSTAQSLFWK